MPDPDGKTGKIVIENKGGTQVVDQAGHVTKVRDQATLPTEPEPMDEKEITRIFGAALAAQPDPPVTFMLYFKQGSSNLTDESAQLLPAIFATIITRAPKEIAVVGHSDRVGSRQTNHKLSLKRAERIHDLIATMVGDPGIIEIDSHGEDNPLVKTPDEVAEPKNRRVEVTLR